ncbi:hypothetical protein MBLNU457_1397t1 [Dothideomycetes sp. NU457]
MAPKNDRPMFSRITDKLFFGQYVPQPNDQNPDLEPDEKESLFAYQISQTRPEYLTPTSFAKAGIIQAENVRGMFSNDDSESKKIHNALIGLEILPDPSVVEKAVSGTIAAVDTSKIDKRFTNKLYFISIRGQRRLVGMLFFWEEECMRWRLLDEEMREVETAIEQAPPDMRAELEMRREAIRMRKRQSPRERTHAVALDAPPNYQLGERRDGPLDAPPNYDHKN